MFKGLALVSTNLVKSANIVSLYCQIERTGFEGPATSHTTYMLTSTCFGKFYYYIFWDVLRKKLTTTVVFCDTIVKECCFIAKNTSKRPIISLRFNLRRKQLPASARHWKVTLNFLPVRKGNQHFAEKIAIELLLYNITSQGYCHLYPYKTWFGNLNISNVLKMQSRESYASKFCLLKSVSN